MIANKVLKSRDDNKKLDFFEIINEPEVTRLQSFSNDFFFELDEILAFKQVNNLVSPLLMILVTAYRIIETF